VYFEDKAKADKKIYKVPMTSKFVGHQKHKEVVV